MNATDMLAVLTCRIALGEVGNPFRRFFKFTLQAQAHGDRKTHLRRYSSPPGYNLYRNFEGKAQG
ncbi:MAG: hypothetical protein ACYC67_11565 [Prosthecobacter sp.]